MRIRSSLLLVCAFTISFAMPVRAVITANTPLKQVVDGAPLIFVAKVQEILPDKPAMVLKQDENLKGEANFGRMPINLTGDAEATKGKHTQVVLDRVEKDLPIVVIVAAKKGKNYSAFGYTNGTWFQMEGRAEQQDGKDVVRWSLRHCEPYLRRTFKGTTADLKTIIIDAVKNKKEPPLPNEKEEPGFGDPIKKAQLERNNSRGVGTLIGVIQLPFIGLIAALAALFPTVFGGLALMMKRWLVLMSVASVVSIVYFLHLEFPRGIRWTGITSAGTLWIACAILTSIGALWSARRYRLAVSRGKAEEMQPRKLDRIGMSVLIALGLGGICFGAFIEKESLLVSPWSAIAICLASVLAGAVYVFLAYFRSREIDEEVVESELKPAGKQWATASDGKPEEMQGLVNDLNSGDTDKRQSARKNLENDPSKRPETGNQPATVKKANSDGKNDLAQHAAKFETRPLSLSAETVMLWAAVFACAYLGALETGRASVHQTGVTRGDAEVVASKELTRNPTLTPEPLWVFKPKENGEILSSPCITPDHVVVSVFHNEGLSQFGRVYALDPTDGKEVWRFPNDADPNSEEEMLPVFCSPVFADGRIYIGEGFHKNENCRMLCLEEATGKKLWEFKTKSHTESTPAVADGIVVFGAGNDGIYVLDAMTGEEVWHYTGEQNLQVKGLHVDANPVIADGLIYASSGYSRTHQVNRIFCLDPKTKTEVWGERVEQSAYGSPAVFDGKVYFTTGNSTFSEHRDPARGCVYCRDAKTGKVEWDAVLPETVICRPAVDREHVYVGCWDGNCYALNRKDGKQKWKNALDGIGVASPFLDRCSVCQTSEVLYVAGKSGAIKALSPQTGKFFWSLDLRHVHPDLPKIDLDGSPVVVREEKGPVVRRRIYVPAGLAQSGVSLPVARLYCYEDANDHSKP